MYEQVAQIARRLEVSDIERVRMSRMEVVYEACEENLPVSPQTAPQLAIELIVSSQEFLDKVSLFLSKCF
jgi:hypothetical protein